jgi:hypothetical protein
LSEPILILKSNYYNSSGGLNKPEDSRLGTSVWWYPLLFLPERRVSSSGDVPLGSPSIASRQIGIEAIDRPIEAIRRRNDAGILHPAVETGFQVG